MKRFARVRPPGPGTRVLRALVLALILPLAIGVARAQPERPDPPPDYTVFVDPPTGFVFVKLPAGWKFVGRIEQADLARLPADVVTRLVPAPARDAGRVDGCPGKA
jgi:hypothetical protein